MLVTTPNQCPNCRAGLPEKAVFCPTCGTRLSYPEQQTSAAEADLAQLVENANQTLLKSGTGAAEFAFGVGCSLATILIVGLLLIMFLFGMRAWTALGVVTVIAVLVATLVAAYLARRARNATLATTYRKVVQPEIEAYLHEHQLTRQEFDDQAADLVASDEPLSQYLSPSPALESEL
ncbi:MAG TPA: zinc-ribbon domain-containing protein [Anaerolineales bacterium]|nr:zinc-ribbon domain-containing protein [Anaerolineales bacterium]